MDRRRPGRPNQVEFAAARHKELGPAFEALGLSLDTMTVQDVSLPEELQKVMDQRIGMGMVGSDMGMFMQYQTGQAIPAMASADAATGQVAHNLQQGLQDALSPVAAASIAPEDVIVTLEKLGPSRPGASSRRRSSMPRRRSA